MILQVENVTKQFGGLTAVDRLSFYVEKSEILGLIGPNGAGKSTVLGVISGLYPLRKGKIKFNDKDITGVPSHEIARLGMCRNFQISSLFMMLPVIQNMFVAYSNAYRCGILSQFLRLPSARREEAAFLQDASQILENMGLGSVQHEMTINLPYGYQRVLGVCVALATKPSLLLLDEPVTGMNQVEIDTMVKLIRKIRDSGVTIVIVEHNVKAVMSLCDRIVVLDAGQKIAEGPPIEIQNNDAVIEAYLGTDERIIGERLER